MNQTANTWRLLDTGIRRAAENIAMNRALLEARQQEIGPNTLRFLGFEPSALLGFHQSAVQELNLDYCEANGIAIQRRITGGGAIYFDTTQLGWELYLHKRDLGTADMTAISRRICEAVARGISTLGITAMFRPRNDIEVDGRKISGTGGAFDGDALMYQGTLLIEFDVEKMLRVLNIPAEKLSDKAIASARDRVTNLADLLGHIPAREDVINAISTALACEFEVQFEPGQLNAAEQRLYNDALSEIDHPDWVNMITHPAQDRPIFSTTRKFAGGMLQVNIAYDRNHHRIKQIWFSGDVFISPRRTLIDLEAALRDSHEDHLIKIVYDFFQQRTVDMLTLTPEDIVTVIKEALANAEVAA
ncbi:lipoate--protein ligase [Sulfuriferula sp. AH1]|uniref:lipoate--protein ligase family protein n=1 Tax=Sulfuriferula sp. AH1 TaxID=1985873 RepID=UPI000B3B23B9|nr:biotin/lipoate A/B protein ligase family protein [Sulfuriferula sp. AH1]ARU30551.1 lipoate--protein ligase [Sulfuriferula sp. AH1]